MKVLRLSTLDPAVFATVQGLNGIKIEEGMALEYTEFVNSIGAVNAGALSVAIVDGTDVVALEDTTQRRTDCVSLDAWANRKGRWRTVIVPLDKFIGRVFSPTFKLTISPRLATAPSYPVTIDIASISLTRWRQFFARIWENGSDVDGFKVATREFERFPLLCEEESSTETPFNDITTSTTLAGNARGSTTSDRERMRYSLVFRPTTDEETDDFFTFAWLMREEPFLYQHFPNKPPRVTVFESRPQKREVPNDVEILYRVQASLLEA